MKTENPYILQLTNLSIGYKKPLLTDINAQIESGEIVLLLGKNGSGKTTLLKSIFEKILILSGNIKIHNLDISKIPISEIGKLISIVLSRSMVNSSLKVFDLIALGRYPYKKWYEKLNKKELNEINEILYLLDLEKYKNYYVSELSDGNMQKALIARALIQDCPLLILDEPTSYLDISNKLEIMHLIKNLAKEKGKTILFTSHDLSLGLSIADKLWFIKDNQIKIGFTEDLANQENILDYFADKSRIFDYNSNEYEFIDIKKRGKIKITGNSKSIYWLEKALIKNCFSITNNAEISISEKDSIFTILYKGKEKSFLSIKEIINFLLSS